MFPVLKSSNNLRKRLTLIIEKKDLLILNSGLYCMNQTACRMTMVAFRHIRDLTGQVVMDQTLAFTPTKRKRTGQTILHQTMKINKDQLNNRRAEMNKVFLHRVAM